MLKRFKRWFLGEYLPGWAKETLQRDIDKLKAENERLRKTVDEQAYYINGLEYGMRSLRKINITVEGNHDSSNKN